MFVNKAEFKGFMDLVKCLTVENNKKYLKEPSYGSTFTCDILMDLEKDLQFKILNIYSSYINVGFYPKGVKPHHLSNTKQKLKNIEIRLKLLNDFKKYYIKSRNLK